MSHLISDLKYAFRMLRKRPGFTAIALITLAIGIGANTVMFSVVNVLLVRPMKVVNPDQLVTCMVRGFRGGFPYEAYVKLRENNPAFTDLVGHDDGMGEVTLVQGDSIRRIMPMYVSSNYFSTLGVRPALGRLFSAEEERSNAQPVAVLSHPAWKRLGGEPGILGQVILLNNVSVQIVGVTPAGFTGTTVLGPDLWLPLGCHGRTRLSRSKLSPEQRARMHYPDLLMTGRIKPGLTRSNAQAQLKPLISALQEDYPKKCQADCAYELRTLPRFSTINTGDGDRLAMKILSTIFMGISGIVLLIACLNLANMLVIQGTARQQEMAIRMAIGGRRLDIMRQLLVESILLALLGGALGVAFALGGMRVLNAWLASAQMPVEFAAALKLGFDMRVLVVTLLVCILAAVLFGLKPAFILTRRDLLSDIKEAGGARAKSRPGRRRVSRGLSVVCQIALSVVLVLGAALLTQSLLEALNPNPDHDQRGKLILAIDPSVSRHDDAPTRQLCDSVIDHVRSLPGIQNVSLSGGARGGEVREYRGEGDSESQARSLMEYSNGRVIGSGYWDAMGIPLLQGRPFEALDHAPGANRVVIIDEFLARQLRPDGNALGCIIEHGQFAWGAGSDPLHVVGIVPYMQSVSDSKDKLTCLYTPIKPDDVPAHIHVRLDSTDRRSEVALLQRLRTDIRKKAPDLSVLSFSTLEEHHRTNLFVWFAGVGARLAVSFGFMSLFLASLGIYAVKGYMVASRTPEIGIRKALGATGQDIMAMVFREGLILTLTGLGLGLFLGWGAVRLVKSMLFGIDSLDPVSIIATVAILAMATLMAGYSPARRAAKIDPMEALRYE